MSAPAFTPGPWKSEPMVFHADNAFYITATPDGNNSEKDVATVGPCLAKTTAANARLIAAAPELYEALAALVEAVMDDDPCEAYPIAKHAGQNALAKARGESSPHKDRT